jgi:hypothetical protein
VTYLWNNVYPAAPRAQRLKAFVAAVAAGTVLVHRQRARLGDDLLTAGSAAERKRTARAGFGNWSWIIRDTLADLRITRRWPQPQASLGVKRFKPPASAVIR